MRYARYILALLLSGFACMSIARADPSPAPVASASAAAGSPDEEANLQKAAANPLASLISVPFQFNANFDQGPLHAIGATLNIQPVIPLSLGGNTNLILRAIVPVAYVPVMNLNPQAGGVLGLGSINPQLYFVPAKPRALLIGPGVTFLLPTSTNPLIGPNKWAAGPDIAIVEQGDSGLYGFIANNLWSFAGSPSNVNVNSFFIQPFYSRTLAHGVTLTASSQTSVNWNAPGNQKWTVPVFFSVSQLQHTPGRPPVTVAGTLGYNLLRPLNSGTWIARFQVTFLYPAGGSKK
jgi:hypothetical protein